MHKFQKKQTIPTFFTYKYNLARNKSEQYSEFHKILKANTCLRGIMMHFTCFILKKHANTTSRDDFKAFLHVFI